MGHHGNEATEEMTKQAFEQLLGPTHKYPMGKMCKEDAGEIAIGIAADLNNDVVIINFGTKVEWLGLSPEQARSIASTLIEQSFKISARAH